MTWKRAIRYLAPNLITCFNVFLGLASLAGTLHGDYEWAAWMIVYAALFDRLDGFVARLVKGASEFGVQMDSFADFLNFGLAPSALVYAAVGNSPMLPFGGGCSPLLLLCACVLWTFAAAFRLARYNVTEDAPSPLRMRVFFGVPTTVVGGLLGSWFLALYKYAPEGQVFPHLAEDFGGPRLLDIEAPIWLWNYTPVIMLIGAYLMASSLRMPKRWLIRSRVTKLLVFGPTWLGVGLAFVQLFPEYMVWPPTCFTVGFLTWGALSPAMRAAKPPPVFPTVDPPPGKEPMRPEDDLVPQDVAPEYDDPDPEPEADAG